LLSQFYNEKINEAIKYLKEKFGAEDCPADSDDYPPITEKIEFASVNKIKIKGTERTINCIVAFPKTFPDTLPKIYLSKEDFKNYYPIPHVDHNRFICTRDPEVTFLYENNINEGLQYLVSVAEKIINDGISKRNVKDFDKEFLAYWNDVARSLKILSLISPTDEISRASIIQLPDNSQRYGHFIVAKSIKEAKDWMENLVIDFDGHSAKEAIYLPLKQGFLPYDINTNNDVLDILEREERKLFKALEEYFNESDSNRVVIFSVPLPEGKALGAWIHEPWDEKAVQGFRRGKIPLRNRLSKTGTNVITKLRVERIDRDRLFSRGGTGITQPIKNSSIAIVGCGSIGGAVAVSLSKSGINNFSLIDNQKIEPENVARYTCGFLQIGFEKCNAIKTTLKFHFPNIYCEEKNDDILDLLQKDESYLNKFNLTIVAIGKHWIERRLNDLQKRGVITTPIVYVWLEPYAVAGQILFIHPYQGGCYACCFDLDSFKYSVASSELEFLKREAGCQSTFVPYSNIELDHFVNIASKKILSFIETPPENSILYTWVGDKFSFLKMGHSINPRWVAELDYSVRETKINKEIDCHYCK